MNSERADMYSLFTGAGGMDVGFRLNSEFNHLFANDILHSPAQTYKKNFSHKIVEIGDTSVSANNLPFYLVGDISHIDFEALKKEDLDLIIGGPPCQDFSIIRGPEKERQGIDVKRGRLYSHFIRSLIHLQPKAFVFENVPGLKSANKGSSYNRIIEDFNNLKKSWKDICKMVNNCFKVDIINYKLLFKNIVDSSDLGVPQKRRRLIIIGAREDLLKQIGQGNTTKLEHKISDKLMGTGNLIKKYPLTPIEAFTGKPLNKLDKEYKRIMTEYENISKHVNTDKSVKWKNKVWDNLTFNILDDYFAINRIIPDDEDEVSKAFEEHIELLKKLGYYQRNVEKLKFPDNSNTKSGEYESVMARMSMIPPDENHMFVKGTEWGVEGRGMSLIYRRIHPLKPAYTVVAYGGGGTWTYHYKRDRGKLTNRERARLQSFPDWFRFTGNNSEMRAQIGEAVPPLLGERIADVTQMILEECSA